MNISHLLSAVSLNILPYAAFQLKYFMLLKDLLGLAAQKQNGCAKLLNHIIHLLDQCSSNVI